jgi:hypothetical protein
LSGLALGLRVVVGAVAAADRVVVRLRIGLGDGGGRGLLVLLLVEDVVAVGGLSGDRVLTGEEERKRFRVFLFWSWLPSSESSSTMARLRRFAGGAIAGDCGLEGGVAFVHIAGMRILDVVRGSMALFGKCGVAVVEVVVCC